MDHTPFQLCDNDIHNTISLFTPFSMLPLDGFPKTLGCNRTQLYCNLLKVDPKF